MTHKNYFLAATVAAFAFATAGHSAEPIDPRVKSRIDRILRKTPLIDGHNDIAYALFENHGSSVANLADETEKWSKDALMTDIARLREGQVGGQFWSVYIDGEIKGDEAIRRTLEQIDIVQRMIAAYPRDFQLALTAKDIMRIHRKGRIASLLGIEGGRQIGGSLPALRQFYDLGVRYMTLTHNQTTEWADSGTDEPKFNGLSPFGLKVVVEMNRLGMLIDLSHVSPEVMRQAITTSSAPVIFSHSSAGGVTPHPRNVPDEVLRLLPQHDGVVMITIVPGFISQAVWDWSANRSGEEARLKAIHRASKGNVEAGLEAWDKANSRPQTDVGTIADHIEHVVRLAGHDHVGIGADMDGIPFGTKDFDGVEDYPVLFAELIRRGWSDRDLAKFAGGNVLRVLGKAEGVAKSLADQQPAMDKLADSK
ncbi:MAG: dipeptidase [Sphingomicrobium sp.]